MTPIYAFDKPLYACRCSARIGICCIMADQVQSGTLDTATQASLLSCGMENFLVGSLPRNLHFKQHVTTPMLLVNVDSLQPNHCGKPRFMHLIQLPVYVFFGLLLHLLSIVCFLFLGFSGSAQLRNYPIKFGVRLQCLLPGFLAAKRSTPLYTDDVRASYCAKALFQNMTMDDVWPESGIVELIVYLKGNRFLRIPSEWRELIPTSI